MKNITVSVDEALYHAARIEAAKQRKSLSRLVREFLSGLTQATGAASGELEELWRMSDRKHARRSGSAGPVNREALYERGLSRH